MKRFLRLIFPKTIAEIEHDAVEEYTRFSDSDVLNNAVQGISFYIRGKTRKDGKHNLYKFTPENLGLHQTVILKPNSKHKKWRSN